MPWNERAKIMNKLSSLLAERKEVLLAIVYGGFINSELFRDIDVAIYTGYHVRREHVYQYEYYVSTMLSEQLGIHVDVKLLDYAPLWFKARTLKTGKIVYAKYSWIKPRLNYIILSELTDIRIKKRKQ